MVFVVSKIEFKHGKRFCRLNKDISCRFLSTRRFATICHCRLFGVDLVEDEYVYRAPECIQEFGGGLDE